MASKKSVLTLVLESYHSCCQMMASLEDNNKGYVALNALTSAFIKNSYFMQMSMFRNVLMDAEFNSNEVTEVELLLKRVEAEHTNKEVLKSVRMIRTKIQQAEPTIVTREGRGTPCVDLNYLADQQDYPD